MQDLPSAASFIMLRQKPHPATSCLTTIHISLSFTASCLPSNFQSLPLVTQLHPTFPEITALQGGLTARGHIPLPRAWVCSPHLSAPPPLSSLIPEPRRRPAFFTKPPSLLVLSEPLHLLTPLQFEAIQSLLISRQYCLHCFCFSNGIFLRGRTMTNPQETRVVEGFSTQAWELD